MASIPAPGVMKLAFSGTAGPDVWACIMHCSYGNQQGAIPQANLNALSVAAMNAWIVGYIPLMTPNWVLDACTVTDLTGPTAGQSVSTTNTPGTRAGAILPNSAAVVLSYNINYKRRGGHPRTYLPPGADQDLLDSSHWTTSFQALVGTKYNPFWAAINTNTPTLAGFPVSQSVPLYTYTYTDTPAKKKYLATRSGYVGNFTVQGNPLVRAQLGSQRRRLRAGT